MVLMSLLAGLWLVASADAQTNGVLREVWLNISGTAVADLTNNPAFPDNPSYREVLTNGFEAPVNQADSYGQRLRALLTPPASGDYYFVIASDDASQLFLSTDETPANKRLVASVTLWTPSRSYHVESGQKSAAVSLTVGTRYYIEALMKEGNGGDNLAVTWQKPGDADPADNSPPIPNENLVPYVLGLPVFAINPTNTMATEGGSANFFAQLADDQGAAYQWMRSGTNIPGATSPTLTLARVALVENGSGVYCHAVNATGSTNSTTATLTVIADTNRPVLLGAYSLGYTQVVARFSERITPTTATNTTNYALSGTNGSVLINGASLDASQSNVVLSVGQMTDSATYTLTVNNLRDQSVAGNIIAPNSRTNFVATAFAATDIGGSTPAGSLSLGGNGWNISGGGADIGGGSDQFQFSYLLYSGDFDVQVRLDSLSLADAWTEAGMLAREDLTPGARSAGVLATPSLNGSYFQFRSATNGATTRSGSFPPNYPDQWLRLKRAGDVFTAYAGFDGQNWTQLGTATLTMPATIYFGFGVSSHDTNQLATAAFRDFRNVTNTGSAGVALPFEPLGPSSRRTALVISEIMYDTPSAWGGTNSLEFVELWNSGIVTQDLTGHKLTGDISYQFPNGATIAPGQFLVVAKDPAAAQSFYGVACLGPYTNKLANGGGTLRLRSELGGILLEINYDNKAPWPAAANGTGHSLVLSHPSYGENDPRAWSASDVIGGSPGRFEHYGAEPARGVVLNEILAHTDPPLVDTLELFNTRAQAVNLSGAWLSDEAGTNKFRIPNGTIIPARGFLAYDSTQLGFALAAEGQMVILVNSNQTRALDAINFPGQANAVSSGRYPDGAPNWQELSARTLGTTNATPLTRPLVINEIMYHPISGSKDDEYVEIYNRGSTNVNVGGWKIQGGIGYTFPSNTVINAGAYFVIAENLTNLLAHYPQLNTTNTFGNFSGSLSHNSDRVALSVPEDLISTNTQGIVVTNIYYFVVDEVTYLDGGRWGQWSDGGGSSLELIDPAADNRLAQNWADSDETLKSQWIAINHSELLDHVFPLGGNGAALNEVQIMLLGAGEALIDDVEVHSETPSTGPNLVANGTFSSGLTGWLIQGNHVRSSLEPAGSNNPSDSLRLRATAGGDNGANRVETDLTTALAVNTTASLKANARWLRGHPELLFRLHGGGMETVVTLPTPLNCGTPGLPNSRRVANAGPAIYDVSHNPVVPADGQQITVTTRVNDPDGISAVRLRYRLDPSETVNTVVMRDDGQLGDAVAKDGLYTATIGGFSAGTVVAFCVQAVDAHTPTTATNYFPADAPSRECVVRVGDPVYSGSLGAYRLWLTATNTAKFANREGLSNEPEDGTFVYNNCRAIYNADIRFRGSPFIRPGWTDLTASGSAYAYVWEMPADDPFLGVTELNTDSGEHGGRDPSALREPTSFAMAKELGMPNTYERFVHIVINGVPETSRGFPIMLDVQQANSDYIACWFPNDQGGDIFKIDDWFEYDDTPGMQGNKSASLQNFTTTGGVKKQARYRWSWEKKANGGYNDDYSGLFDAVDACNAPDADYVNHMEQTFELEEWVGEMAFRHAVCDWDGYGYNRGKNQFIYRPPGGKFWMLPWDLDFSLGCNGGHGPQQNLFTLSLGGDAASDNMPEVNRMYNHPHIRRIFLQTLQRLANGPLQDSHYLPLLEARDRELRANGVTAVSPFVGSGGQGLSIPDWIQQRRAYILGQLPADTFGLTTNSLTVSSNLALISGTAPLDVKSIELNGVVWPVTWTGVTTWTISVPVTPGTNIFIVLGCDFSGAVLSGASNQVSVAYNPGTLPPSPAGVIAINEIMYSPSIPDAEYVEMFNTSSNCYFNLSGWHLNGVGYDFPDGSFIGPRSYLLLAKDRVAFSSAYGLNVPVFDVYDGNLSADGETLSLIMPAALTGTNDFVVDRVRYEAAAPWSATTNGVSLQLVDATQDNSRVANWSTGISSIIPGTPATNITLKAYTNVWKYMQTSNLDGVNWTATNFNDLAWPSGPGLLAFENNPAITNLIKTVLNDPRVATNNALAGHGYYFRTTLYLTNNPAGYTFNASAYVDDGAVLYVNGNEITPRIRMNTGTVTNMTLASGTPPGGDATSPDTFTIPASVFRVGTNFMAVEVHQSATSSSDIVFGLKLDATNSGSAAIIVAAATPGTANAIATNLPPFPPLWLNEAQADNITGPTDNFGQRDPWTELYNSSGTNFSLSGYYLSDTYTNLTKWAFPTNASIPASGFAVVWCDNETNQTTTNSIHANFRLSSGSGRIALSRIVSNTVQIVDYLNYTNLPANWSYGDVPDGQPFYRQRMIYTTPGATNNYAVAPITLFINEWMADNTHTLADPADNDYEDWFELYNPGSNTVALDGYWLTDNLTNKFQYEIPNNGHYVVPPHGFLLVWADNETGQNNTNRPDLHVNFKLDKAGEAIGLFAADGTAIDAVTFGPQTNDVSEGRFPDGSANLYFMPTPTPRTNNVIPNTAPALSAISDQYVHFGQTVHFTATATDSDVPAQTLTFSLTNSPAGAGINAASGAFSWTATNVVVPSTNTITVRVTDNGSPPLSDAKSFSVYVLPLPQLGQVHLDGFGNLSLSFGTLSGQTYQVEYKDNLDDLVWTPLGAPVAGNGGTLQVNDDMSGQPQRFYRLVVLP
jgi:hypothetical protein